MTNRSRTLKSLLLVSMLALSNVSMVYMVEATPSVEKKAIEKMSKDELNAEIQLKNTELTSIIEQREAQESELRLCKLTKEGYERRITLINGLKESETTVRDSIEKLNDALRKLP